MAAHAANQPSHQVGDGDPLFHFAPFQRLDWLVRDWKNFTRGQSLDEKRQAIRNYLEGVLMGPGCHEAVQHSRRFIVSSFGNVSCFLLPHPGLQVTDPEFDGSLAAVEPGFLELATSYFDEVFGLAQPESKTFLGDPATCGDLLRFAKRYVEVFKENLSFPSSEAIAAAMEDVGNEKLKQEALRVYTEAMQQCKIRFYKLISDAGEHLVSKKKALDFFDSETILRDWSKANVARDQLLESITKEYLRFKASYQRHNETIKAVMVAAAVVGATLAAIGGAPSPPLPCWRVVLIALGAPAPAPWWAFWL